jgi:hypothetical protein
MQKRSDWYYNGYTWVHQDGRCRLSTLISSHKLQATSHKLQATSGLTKLNRYRIIEDINKRRNMESTIKLIQQMNKTLVEVIQFLDSNGHSDTDVRKKVDTILNFTNDLKEESEMELTKLTLVE